MARDHQEAAASEPQESANESEAPRAAGKSSMTSNLAGGLQSSNAEASDGAAFGAHIGRQSQTDWEPLLEATRSGELGDALDALIPPLSLVQRIAAAALANQMTAPLGMAALALSTDDPPIAKAGGPETRAAAGFVALEAAGLLEAFLTLVSRSRPYSDRQREQLGQLYDALPFEHRRQLFAHRFADLEEPDGAGFTADELDTLHEQARLLPPGHVEDLATFQTLGRNPEIGAYGYYQESDNLIMLDEMVALGYEGASEEEQRAEYSQTLRHEVGHAIDAALGSESDAFRADVGGWKIYENPTLFASELGLAALPVWCQGWIPLAINAFAGPGSVWQSPHDSFEAALEAMMIEHPSALNAGSVAEEIAATKRLADSHPGLRWLFDHPAGNPNWALPEWPILGGRAFFVSFYYGNCQSVKAETVADLMGWPSMPYQAAFSDFEWFAETYALYFSTPEPGTAHSWQAGVGEFFANRVEPLGESR